MGKWQPFADHQWMFLPSVSGFALYLHHCLDLLRLPDHRYRGRLPAGKNKSITMLYETINGDKYADEHFGA
jgi:hypothetical protein